MKKTVLVTGSTGFVGKKLCEKLIINGYDIIPLSTKDGDVADKSFFEKYRDKSIDHVFHLAAKTFVPKSWSDPADFIEKNVLGTMNVLEFCNFKKCSLTFVSAYIYGADVANPIAENALPHPNNPYALSKKMSEDLCNFYAKYFNLTVNIVRPFNIYGAGQSEDFLIPYIVKQINSNAGEIRVKDLTPKRDYIHVDDVVDFLMTVMNYKQSATFNAASGKSHSVLEVINCLLELSGLKWPVVSENSVRNNEISDTIADISKAKKILNWEPKIDLKQGLKTLLKK